MAVLQFICSLLLPIGGVSFIIGLCMKLAPPEAQRKIDPRVSKYLILGGVFLVFTVAGIVGFFHARPLEAYGYEIISEDGYADKTIHIITASKDPDLVKKICLEVRADDEKKDVHSVYMYFYNEKHRNEAESKKTEQAFARYVFMESTEYSAVTFSRSGETMGI
jgi:hypothetical protein